MMISQKNVEKFSQRRGFSLQKMVSGRQTNKEINKKTGRQTDLKILRIFYTVLPKPWFYGGNLAAKEMVSTEVFRPASLISV